MPENPLTESDLRYFSNTLLDKNKLPDEHFNTLKLLYARFAVNEENLIRLEYTLDIEHTRVEHSKQKEISTKKLNLLKSNFKQLDNRIVAAEQKLARGIPDDLEVMEKIISEQESIVEEQEKLNAAESVLIKDMSEVDINYGKALEKLDQMLSNRISPLQNRFDNYSQSLENAKKHVNFRARLIFLLPLIGLPMLTDFFLAALGLTNVIKLSNVHLILSHYVFFITLILFQLFLSDKIMSLILARLSSRYFKSFFKDLEVLLRENLNAVGALKENMGISD